MNYTEKIIVSIITILFITACQYITYKFPSFYLNFGSRNGRNGFGINSRWYRRDSKEVKQFQLEQKERIVKMLKIEVVVAILFVIFY